MADQARTSAGSPVDTGQMTNPSLVEESTGATHRFPPRGVPVFDGINRIGLWSLYMKEVRRFLKVQTQTIWAPAVTTLVFRVIFTLALGVAVCIAWLAVNT